MNIQHYDDKALLFMHTEDIHLLAPILFPSTFTTVYCAGRYRQSFLKAENMLYYISPLTRARPHFRLYNSFAFSLPFDNGFLISISIKLIVFPNPNCLNAVSKHLILVGK